MLFQYTHSFYKNGKHELYDSFVGVADKCDPTQTLEKGFRVICETRVLDTLQSPDAPVDIKWCHGFEYQEKTFDEDREQKTIEYKRILTDTSYIRVTITVDPSNGNSYCLFDNL